MRAAVMTIRMVSDWLADATNGVNAEIAKLVTEDLLDAGDAVPPNVEAILTATKDDIATRRELPTDTKTPILMVVQGDALTVPQGHTQNRIDISDLPVAVLYGTRDVASAAGEEDAYYTLDAAMRSLNNLWTGPNESARTRKGIEISKLNGYQVLPTDSETADRGLQLALIARFHVRETTPI